MCGVPSNMNSSSHKTWQTFLFLKPLQMQNLKRKNWRWHGILLSPLPEKVGETHPQCPPPNCGHPNNAYHFNFYVQVPVACFSSLVLTLKKHFVCLGFFIIFWGLLKVNYGVFLHIRVATLVARWCQNWQILPNITIFQKFYQYFLMPKICHFPNTNCHY